MCYTLSVEDAAIIEARMSEATAFGYRVAHIADVECVECCAMLVDECPWAATTRHDGVRLVHGWHVALAWWA